MNWRYSFHFAGRSLRRHPIVLVAGVTSFALGIGATTTVLAVIDNLYLSPPSGVQSPSDVVRVMLSSDIRAERPALPGTENLTSYPTYAGLRQNTPGVEIAGESSARPQLEASGLSARVHAQLVSTNYFSMLGVRAADGRLIDKHDGDMQHADPVVVLSYQFWRQQLGGRADVIGRIIRLNSNSFTVIGIAPKGFNGVVGGNVDLWVPLELADQLGFHDEVLTSTQTRWVELIARRPANTSKARMAFTIAATAAGIANPPLPNGTLPRVRFSRTGAPRVQAEWASAASEHSAKAIVAALAIFSGVILLIACVNVANLLLARGEQRHSEMAMRFALGARPSHIVELLTAESILLAGLGGAFGLLFAQWGHRLIRLIPGPGQPFVYGGRTMAVCLVVTLLSALFAGALPTRRALRSGDVVHLGGDGGASGPGRRRTRSVLLGLQVSLAFALLVGAGLMLRSVHKLQRVDTGMVMDQLLVVTRDPYAGLPSRRIDWTAMLTPVRDRLAAVPGVERASLAMGAPFQTTFQAEAGLAGTPTSQDIEVQLDAVDSGYFRALGVPLQRGRAFSAADMRGDQPIAVINEVLARALWPHDDAIGKCFRWKNRTNACLRVIGVVRNSMYGSLSESPGPMFYIPVTSAQALPFRSIMVRTRRPATEMVGPVSAVLAAAEGSGLRRFTVAPLAAAIAPEITDAEIRADVLSWFAVIALTMVAVGLYGSVTYSTTQRAREIAIRIAVGADTAQVQRMVVREALAIAGGGIVIGCVVAAAASTLIAALLFGVTSLDPATYAIVAGVILATTCIAAFVPARAACTASPMATLRT